MEIIVDITCDLPEEYKNKVKYIPVYIIKGDMKIKMDEKFDYIKDFYENKELRTLWIEGKLKTSQPSIKDVIDVLKNVDDREILVITASKLLTGIYNVAKNASRFIKDKKIIVYDSGIVSIALGFLVKQLLDKIEKESLNIKEAVEFLDSINITAYFVPQDINFLFKSGRINIIKYAFLKIAKKKPLMRLERYREVEFVKLVDNDVKELKKFYKKLWGADYFNFNKIPKPKVLINPTVVINTGPIIACI